MQIRSRRQFTHSQEVQVPLRPRTRRTASRVLFSAAVVVATGASCAGPPAEDPGGLVDVNGTELFVRRLGEGAPVVVVHGGPVMEHGYLLPWLEPLADGHELVFFDQRLSGRSAGAVDSASVRLDTLVADMEALRAELGYPRMHLLAHSWGGLLALRYAILHPNRVESLVLVSPMAASAALWQEEEAALAARITPGHQEETTRLRAAPGLAEGDTAAIAALLRHSFRTQFHDPERAAELDLHVPDDYLERSRQFGFMMPDLTGFDFHPELDGVTAPVLLVYGDEEPGSELGGRALEAGLPDATLVRIPRAGHFAFMEEPEAFLAAVRSFLDRPSPGGGSP